MRTIILLAFVLNGCGDANKGQPDGSASAGDDLSMSSGSLGDLAGTAVDASCMMHAFPGFAGGNSEFRVFDCNCGGCVIDSFENNVLNSNWGSPVLNGAAFVPMQYVGLGVMLTSSAGQNSIGGLISEGPTAQFYLDGDFDMQVDYDLGATPPGESSLVFGAQIPKAVGGTPLYRVSRDHHDNGTDAYHSNLGGIDHDGGATTAINGRLRLARVGYTVTAYADGQQVQTLIAPNANRLVVTLAASLSSCSGGASQCSWTPRWHMLRMNSGRLVNQP